MESHERGRTSRSMVRLKRLESGFWVTFEVQVWKRGQFPQSLPAWPLSRPFWHHPVHSLVANPDATEDQHASKQETRCDRNTLDLLV